MHFVIEPLQKRVVLEYLSHHTYLSTAQALSRGRRPPRPAENGASSFPSDPNGEDVSMAIDDDDTRSEEDEEDDGADQMMASVMMAEPSSGPRPVAVAAVGALSAPSSSGPKGREASSTTGWTHEPGDLNEEQLLDIERRRGQSWTLFGVMAGARDLLKASEHDVDCL